MLRLWRHPAIASALSCLTWKLWSCVNFDAWGWLRREDFEDPAAAAAAASVVRVRAYDVFQPWGRSHGSGFLWQDGLIVTNFHVVQHAAFLAVQFADGTEHRARVRGASRDCDLAVLELSISDEERGRLPPALRLQRATPPVSSVVAAVGHPGHFAGLLTTGVVSAVGRRSSRVFQRLRSEAMGRFQRRCAADGMLLTTAYGGPGSSGGPLFTTSGRVAGVTTWGLPASRLMVAIRPEILSVVLPILATGSDFQPHTAGLSLLMPARLTWPSHFNGLLGLRLSGARLLWPGGPARKAGLRSFDELLRVGKQVKEVEEVVEGVQDLNLAGKRELEVVFRRLGESFERHALIHMTPIPARPLRTRVLRLFEKAVRLYLAVRFLKATVKATVELSEDSVSLLRGVPLLLRALDGSNQWNTSGAAWKESGSRLLKFTSRSLLEAPNNVCGSFSPGTCREGASAPIRWANISSLHKCRLKCESKRIELRSGCCSYEGRLCQLVPVTNLTDAAEPSGSKGSGEVALCSAVRLHDVIEASTHLSQLLWRLIGDR